MAAADSLNATVHLADNLARDCRVGRSRFGEPGGAAQNPPRGENSRNFVQQQYAVICRAMLRCSRLHALRTWLIVLCASFASIGSASRPN